MNENVFSIHRDRRLYLSLALFSTNLQNCFEKYFKSTCDLMQQVLTNKKI